MTLYNYGISQEDALTESKALDLKPHDNLLCIASAGEIPLNILALHDIEITAVDTELPQIHLSKLKLQATLNLESDQAAGFLGFMKMNKFERKNIFQSLRPKLSKDEHAFWEQHIRHIENGVINTGRFEQYISRFRPIVRSIIGRRKLSKLLTFKNIEKQREFFNKEINSFFLRLLFKIIFHPRIYKNRGIQEKGLINERDSNMSTFFFSRLRDFCTSTLSRQNYYYQYTFWGHVIHREALPEYLQPSGQINIRNRQDQLRFEHCTFSQSLQHHKPFYFNKFHLSNIGDWMDSNDFKALLFLINKKAADTSSIVYRYIHLYHPIPENLTNVFQENLVKGNNLMKNDRYPFYRIVPMLYSRDAFKTNENL